MKRIFTIMLLCLFSTQLLAQQRAITGKVTDANGNPIAGATVYVPDSQKGAVTDMSGSYNIEVGRDQVIEFSFFGYEDQVLNTASKSTIDVVLKEATINIDNVEVTVGYGSMRKSDITGSLSSLSVSETMSQQVQTVDQLLNGRVAGVQMIGNESSPNSGVSIKIRGATSLRSNTEPLYVVDGVIITSAGEDAASASTVTGAIQESQNGLNGINPRDIESMEILKDASATAIYGSQGANGVILITTKQGAKGKEQVNAYATMGVSNIANKIDILSGANYAMYRNESSLLTGGGLLYQVKGDEVYPIAYGANGLANVDTEPSPLYNYQDELYIAGVSYTAGLSISGGSEKGNHYISLAYNNLEGITKSSKFQDGTVRVNLNRNISDKFKIKSQLSAYYGEGSMFQDADQWGGNRSIINLALIRNPIANTYEDASETQGDVFAMLDDFADVSTESRVIGSISGEYSFPIKGLKYQLRTGVNMRNKERRRWYGSETYQGNSVNCALGISDLATINYNVDNLITYNRVINKNHRINAMVGVTWSQNTLENSIYSVQDFITDEYTTTQPAYAQTVASPLSMIISNSQLLTYMGRLNYSLFDKYLLTATFRADGSSKFAKKNRFSYFPSFAAAWRLSEEQFIKDLGFVDNLKFRAGWGQTGNQGVSAYQTQTNYASGLYSTVANATSVTFVASNVSNPDLKWETTQQTNLGLDIDLFDRRLTGVVDLYSSETKDLLQQVELAGSTGYSSMLVNKGNLKSKGMEVALTGVIISSDDVEFSIGGNVALNKTVISYLGTAEAPLYINGKLEDRAYYIGGSVAADPYNIFVEGEEIGLFYGYKTDGIYQEGDAFVDGAQAGDVKIIDLNGDGQIDTSDCTTIGNPNPELIYGINLNFRYKRLSLNAQFDGSYGNEIATGAFMNLDVAAGTQNNILTDAYKQAWRAESPSNAYPRIGATLSGLGAPTDRQISDGSYARLNNVTLSYDIPVKRYLSKCQVYIAGSNLLTLTSYRGYTPIVTSYLSNSTIVGVDWNNPPTARTITLGVTANF